MDIAEILKNEQGRTFFCDVRAVVKKPKSKLKTGEEWTQECVLSDLSGDIQAEVLLAGTSLGRGEEIRIVSAQIQHGADCDKLFVIGYVQETATEPEPKQHYSPAEIAENKGVDWDKIARGKTKCNLVCAAIAGNQIDLFCCYDGLDLKTRQCIEVLINYIFE